MLLLYYNVSIGSYNRGELVLEAPAFFNCVGVKLNYRHDQDHFSRSNYFKPLLAVGFAKGGGENGTGNNWNGFNQQNQHQAV